MINFRHFTSSAAQPLIDTLVQLEREVYADAEPSEFNNENRYRRQLSGHMAAPGWEMVTAHEGEEMVGYAYGFPLQPGTRWWQGLLTPAADETTRETGTRTFALSELMVRAPWRGQGIGHALHDELLAQRHEERATLLVELDNTDARARYARWGWTELGHLRPSWEGAPLFQALLLPMS